SIILYMKKYTKAYYTNYVLKGISYDLYSSEKSKLQNLAIRLYYIAFPERIEELTAPQQVKNKYKNKYFQVFSNIIKKYFKNNIKYSNAAMDSMDDDIITQNKDELWKYMLHNDGNELEELKQYLLDNTARTRKTSVEQTPLGQNLRTLRITIDLSNVKSNDLSKVREALTEITDIIISTRKIMGRMRKDKMITKKTRRLYKLFSLTCIIIVTGIFYTLYKFTNIIRLPQIIIVMLLFIVAVMVMGIVYDAMVH
ncbi:MAG: hypothetical protein EBU66_17625, partial [Bacteroidetes bacterium]|nr:hypothetical protein [Bacteroidota bacterium]